MKYPDPPFIDPAHIFTARFLERPNRFLVRCVADELGEIEAHLPNPGRLWELLLPGVRLHLQEANSTGRGGQATRKTRYTVLAAERDGIPVFLHTHATNQVARHLVENGLIPALKGARIVKAEVPVGRSRFDFLLRKNGHDLYMEVKSCTLFGKGVAMFPDAVTRRGRRHLAELSEMGRQGIRSAILFVIHCPHVKWFMPDYHTDLDFSTTFLQVRHRIQMIPAAVGWQRDLTFSRKVKILEIPWHYLEREVKDRGGYLLILRLKRRKTIRVEKLERVTFSKGYYLYVGSAIRNLSGRMARYKRARGRCQEPIDFLTNQADKILTLPVRSSENLACNMARALSSEMKPGPAGFGSSGCGCRTHLFQSETNPIQESGFHHILQSFRMRSP